MVILKENEAVSDLCSDYFFSNELCGSKKYFDVNRFLAALSPAVVFCGVVMDFLFLWVFFSFFPVHI